MGTKVRLSVACGDYEIVRALKEGTVQADGLELVVLTGHGPRERHWRMARNLEYDVCEFNVGAYFMARARVTSRSPGFPSFSTVDFVTASLSSTSTPASGRRRT